MIASGTFEQGVYVAIFISGWKQSVEEVYPESGKDVSFNEVSFGVDWVSLYKQNKINKYLTNVCSELCTL